MVKVPTYRKCKMRTTNKKQFVISSSTTSQN